MLALGKSRGGCCAQSTVVVDGGGVADGCGGGGDGWRVGSGPAALPLLPLVAARYRGPRLHEEPGQPPPPPAAPTLPTPAPPPSPRRASTTPHAPSTAACTCSCFYTPPLSLQDKQTAPEGPETQATGISSRYPKTSVALLEILSLTSNHDRSSPPGLSIFEQLGKLGDRELLLRFDFPRHTDQEAAPGRLPGSR